MISIHMTMSLGWALIGMNKVTHVDHHLFYGSMSSKVTGFSLLVHFRIIICWCILIYCWGNCFLPLMRKLKSDSNGYVGIIILIPFPFFLYWFAQIQVYLYGGQVTSWKNEYGEELLFVSSKVLIYVVPALF